MRIRVTDTDRVQAALDAVQGEDAVRPVGAQDVASLAEWAECKLANEGLPLAKRQGAEAWFVSDGGYKRMDCYVDCWSVLIRRGPESWCFERCALHRKPGREPAEYSLGILDGELGWCNLGHQRLFHDCGV